MTTKLLKVHPKVYWIWNHRRWCLEHIPEGPNSADAQTWRLATWERELFIVEKMLEADSRNCLCSCYENLFVIHNLCSSSSVGLSSLCRSEHARSPPRQSGACIYDKEDRGQLLEL
jgi:hypothetical protein